MRQGTSSACSIQDVNDQIEEAKKSPEPAIEDLWLNIYKDGLGAKLRGLEMGRPKIQLPNGPVK
jgi:pyruvate dehydrogenase E1 component alpha subunit